MKYIKTYESFNFENQFGSDEEMNEGLFNTFKNIALAGLLLFSTYGTVKSQTTATSNTGIEYKLQQNQLDSKIISKLVKYYNQIITQKDNFKTSQEGKYKITKASNFVVSSKEGTGYNKKNIFIVIGDESMPDAQISVTLKDDGKISIILGDDRVKETYIDNYGNTIKAGTQLMDQTEIGKNDQGYKQALEMINIF